MKSIIEFFKSVQNGIGVNFIAKRGKAYLMLEEEKMVSASNNTPTFRRNAMSTVSITSNEGKLSSASAVLEVAATNKEYNQPALHIKQVGFDDL